jgi:cytidine deaminase
METKKMEISYQEFSTLEEMQLEDRKLSLAAIDAMKGAYAPYSSFFVGAAVRLDDGTVVTGANQENAAFPSGLCAERTAMFSAGAAYPDKAMVSIAIAGGAAGVLDSNPASPCGACRQVMAQYQKKGGKDMSIILVGNGRILKFSRVDDLLPFIFDNI